ncbi:MAG: glycerol-3-phosphate 1-O-acyltransferase PlsY [Candidatus Accumulibacter sp.]|jgi:glycerol-3-phosphate acyltransferase PlsY|nr:glycerol-3-phosphate 1-O-acyltransferase PlsY [Accumulibacter sp.]
MSEFLIVMLAALAAYLLGSVPFAVVCSRLFGLADPRSYGSGNPGATNVLRSGNKAAAACTLAGDMAKGWLAVFLAQACGPRFGLAQGLAGVVALAVFFGHVYPVFLKFKGGKGVATAAGVLLAIDPLLGLTTVGIWLAVAFILRYSSLAALVAAAAAPLIAFLLWGGGILAWVVGIIAMTLIVRHWANLQRLMAGTEPKIGAKKKT